MLDKQYGHQSAGFLLKVSASTVQTAAHATCALYLRAQAGAFNADARLRVVLAHLCVFERKEGQAFKAVPRPKRPRRALQHPLGRLRSSLLCARLHCLLSFRRLTASQLAVHCLDINR